MPQRGPPRGNIARYCNFNLIERRTHVIKIKDESRPREGTPSQSSRKLFKPFRTRENDEKLEPDCFRPSSGGFKIDSLLKRSQEFFSQASL